MTKKTGLAGLGTGGGVAAAGAVVALFIGVLYATGRLSPTPEAETQAAVSQPQTGATTPSPATDAPATDAPVTEAPETEAPVTEAPETEAESAADTAEAETPAAEPSDPQAEATAPAETDAPAAEAPALAEPRLDVVRASPDGMTVIAGQAAPGSLVTVLIDGADVQSETADAGGEFVALVSLPPSDAARVLTLRATLGEQSVLSGDEIILAPTPAPAPEPAAEEVAAAQPQAGTLPQTAPAAETETAATGAGAEASAEAAPEPTAETTAEAAGTSEEQTATGTAPDSQVAEAQSTGQDAEQAASETVAPAAPAPVAVLRSDAEGVELVQPATPTPDIAPQQVVLDTIGYAEDGAVLLSGRAEPGATIRVYLDNAPVSDLATAGDGRWRGTLGAVSPGIYTLRLDALDGAGAVISRLETPFKREAPEVLARAQAQVAAQTPPPAPQVSRVTVQAGDTLWAISRERYGDGLLYVRVFDANRDSIRNPDLIYPGQVFTLPD